MVYRAGLLQQIWEPEQGVLEQEASFVQCAEDVAEQLHSIWLDHYACPMQTLSVTPPISAKAMCVQGVLLPKESQRPAHKHIHAAMPPFPCAHCTSSRTASSQNSMFCQ